MTYGQWALELKTRKPHYDLDEENVEYDWKAFYVKHFSPQQALYWAQCETKKFREEGLI